jgi:UDP-N-acetylmuramoylalanine--D-glutamate ligase
MARLVAAGLPGTPLVLVDEGPPPPGLAVESDPAALLGCDVVVRSPGISRYRPEVARLAAAGVELTTGTNLWFAEHPDALTIAVTGTKGKSTTSALIAHLAASRGLRVRLAGNIGLPLVDLLAHDDEVDLWVLELSSFQTSDLEASPSVGVLLNLYREHTDWHGTQQRYWADKLALFAHRPQMHSVLNGADAAVRARAALFPHPIWFRDPGGFDVAPSGITLAGRPYADRERIALVGDHNLDNVCAALAALAAAGIEGDDLIASLGDFTPLAHRLEPLGERGGILFVNDSIATIPEATVAAARAIAPRPTVLLVGGRDRRQDYASLVAHLAGGSAVVAVVGMPANGPAIVEAIAGAPVETASAGDLADAVARALALVPPGGAVLLSPGAPTGDEFGDFQVRGDAFREIVEGLAKA